MDLLGGVSIILLDFLNNILAFVEPIQVYLEIYDFKT